MSERLENIAYEEGYRAGWAACREECAKVADAARRKGAGTSAYDSAHNFAAEEIAQGIRALAGGRDGSGKKWKHAP